MRANFEVYLSKAQNDAGRHAEYELVYSMTNQTSNRTVSNSMEAIIPDDFTYDPPMLLFSLTQFVEGQMDDVYIARLEMRETDNTSPDDHCMVEDFPYPPNQVHPFKYSREWSGRFDSGSCNASLFYE